MAYRELSLKPQLRTFPKNESGFVRVKQNDPCSVCGKMNWCTRSGDGALAYCMRIGAGSIKQLANGAYVHTQAATGYNPTKISVIRKPLTTDLVVDAETRDTVYRYLLTECLTLDADHADHLMTERGFGDTSIVANLYASTPKVKDRLSIGKQLAKRFGENLRGVAGFYIEPTTGDWRFRFPQSGFLIPCLNEFGQIVGLMVRRNGNVEYKYYWISTPTDRFEGGASSGTPIHFSQPHRIKLDRHVIITEGILKADRITEFYDSACIGIAGVHNFPATFADNLKQQFPEIELVRIAFDADFVTNPHVWNGLTKLVDLMANVFETRILKWNPSEGKGLDDVLFSEREGNNE